MFTFIVRRLLALIPVAIAAAAWISGSRGTCVWAPALIVWAGIASLLPATNAPVGTWVNRLLAGIPVIDLCLVFTLFSKPLDNLSAWTLFAFPAAVALSLLFQRWFKAT